MIEFKDDETGAVIPDDTGVEVTVLLEDGKRKLLHFAGWDGIPRRITSGTVAGKRVVAVTVRDRHFRTSVRPGRTVPTEVTP